MGINLERVRTPLMVVSLVFLCTGLGILLGLHSGRTAMADELMVEACVGMCLEAKPDAVCGYTNPETKNEVLKYCLQWVEDAAEKADASEADAE